ncbi:hypothetical protein GCM10019817_07260 [Lactobacillus intestinalis]
MKKIKLIEVNGLFNPYVSFFSKKTAEKHKVMQFLKRLFK